MKRIIVLIAVASVVLCFIPATAMGVTTNDKDVTAYETNFIRVASLALEKDTDALLRGHCCMMIAGPEETPTPLFAPTDMKECETHSTRMLPRTNCGKTAANLYQSAGRWYDTISFYAGGGSMPQVIYVADDEKNIRQLIAAFLTQEGFQVQTFPTGDALLSACEERLPDLVVLDIMMPGTDGLSICSALRKASAQLPIIIVSAKDSPYDRVTGLTLGSDDYLIKPFLPLELVARVKALLRRAGGASQTAQPDQPLEYGPLVLSPELRTAAVDGEPLTLTPTEFDFLAYLIQNRDRAVSREELLQALWQVDWQADTRAADDLMKRLRRKLRERDSQVRIETVWGYGFRLVLEEKEL